LEEEVPRRRTRARAKIFSCSICDEVFVDEESLRRHEETHKNPEAAEEAAPPPEPEPELAPAAEEAPPAEGAPPQRTLSSVRRRAQAAAAREQAATPVEADNQFLPPATTSVVDMPVDPDATVAVPHSTLAPMAWEEAPSSRGGGFGFGRLWGFVEDFSEWFVRGTQNTAGVVGNSVLSGVGLAFRGILLILLGCACVYAGTWFGRVYGPKIWKQPGDKPVIPPSRTVVSGPQEAQKAVRVLIEDFYRAIHAKKYQDAYACLSSDWQGVLSYEQFSAGYAATEAAQCRVDSVRSLPGGKYALELSLVVTERGRQQQLHGTYVAVPTASGWKLDEGDIR
jgi:hypothetical protein